MIGFLITFFHHLIIVKLLNKIAGLLSPFISLFQRINPELVSTIKSILKILFPIVEPIHSLSHYQSLEIQKELHKILNANA